MTDEPPKFSDLGADEQQAFFDLADDFIHVANAASSAGTPAVAAAAFLYACARYNALAMQTLGRALCEIDEEIVAYLVQDFERKLREQMSARVTEFPAESATPPARPAAIEALRALDDLDDQERSEFYDLADRFINVANAQIRSQRVTRISAAFMYGCARFNTHVLHIDSFDPGRVDEDAVSALRDSYEATLRMHMEEALIKPSG